MRNVILHSLDPRNTALLIESNFHLREIEFQRSRVEPQAADALRELIRVMQHLFDRTRRRTLQNFEGLEVAEAALRMDHRREMTGLQDSPVLIDKELHALRQTIHVRLERAEIITQCLGQHRNHTIDQIGRVAASTRLLVQRGACFHIVRDVGDVDPEFPVLSGNTFKTDGVVEVLGIIRIDGHDRMAAAIFPSDEFLGMNLASDRAGFVEDSLGEMEREIVLAEHGEHVHALLIGSSENLHDLAFRVGVPGLPGA